ncbi:GlxA family transcriptional regulator [Mesorhizobium sp. B2-3-5]|uniref:GlxA family transcriptional regulator n=1 Tax=Mesorhizobium sp. B2-3-5 TaxID=2589958 RepID=UPI001AEEB94F|nr:GlxA family transcriptional regulator [Mesorhizobium sp. B2-3-5]
MATRLTEERHVVLAVYPGVSLLDLGGPLEAFRVFSEFGGDHRIRYKCTVVSSQGGQVATADGVPLVAQSIKSLYRVKIDTLIVPGAFLVDDVTRDVDLIKWVARTGPRCRRVCSVCVGSFLLAAAGLLKGRRAATHWMHAKLLAQRYPEITVEPDAIFVRDGRVWSSAGVTTGIDLALALIEDDCGREAAMSVARMLVVYLKRAGGQSQYSALLATQGEADSDAFIELDRWIAENLTTSLNVEALAERMHMSLRNFTRVYTQKRGRTPAKAVEAIRLDAARRLLEESDDRIEGIAETCGYRGEEQMRAAFVRVLNIPPREYRRRFATRNSSLARSNKAGDGCQLNSQ